MYRQFRFEAITLVMCLAFAAVCLAQAPPSADTYVTSARPAANYGSSPILPVQSGTTSYVRLNLAALPANATIAKATLRLYVDAVAAPGAFDVLAVNSAWSEPALTFTDAPVLGASATGGQSTTISKASVNQFVLIDVTALAQGWLDGSIANHGVALMLTSSTGSFAFDSKESSGHHPELEVVLAATPLAVSAGTSESSASSTTSASRTTSVAVTSGGVQVNSPSQYIDNSTALQTQASFNIDGSGSATTFNATSQYQLAGAAALGTNGVQSLFVGPGAGTNNTGTQNTFLGVNAGQANTTGNYNTFAGMLAGLNNTSGSYLTFLGMQAGSYNTTGQYNTFVGTNSGNHNVGGNYNTFLGGATGFNNQGGTYNTFVGMQSGQANIGGQYNSFFGTNSGVNSTADYNTFLGGATGFADTTGDSNTFVGMNAGGAVVTGSQNTYVGFNTGLNANPAGNNNVYLANQGQPTDNATLRIGDPASQSATYIAGINGAPTAGGTPVFIDATGKLGTMGGSVSFTQVTGTLTSPQLAGSYSNAVTLSNTTNIFDGSFTGNGSGLTGVTSGLSWPIVQKTADYTVQTGDFSTPTTYGNFIVLTGQVAHTFTLPNPAPPNGSCVAIGNFAKAAVRSNTNVFLTVNASGLNMDGIQTASTQPGRQAFLYCSDGSGYWRLNREQNNPNNVGEWLYTQDSSNTSDTLKTTFVHGLDSGLNTGTTVFILPTSSNTTATPTLDVNALGPKRILKFGNRALAPNDLTAAALAILIYDGQFWQLVNPQTVVGTVTSVTASLPLVSSGGATPNIICPTCATAQLLTGTTSSIGGTALTAGSCATGTASVTGAVIGHPVSVSASDGSLPNGFIILSAAVTGPNSVTVQLCATASVTPAANIYNVTTQ
jgi:hypothetical protein